MNTILDKLPDFEQFEPLSLDAPAAELGGEASVLNHDFEHERCVSSFMTLHAPRVIPPQSKILLLAGEVTGDAVWLSAQGHAVTVAMKDTRALARARAFVTASGFDVELLEVNLQHAQFGLQQWDIVVLYHLHLPELYRSQVHRRAARALKRGGVLLLEESWIHLEIEEEAMDLVQKVDVFGDFFSEVEDSEMYTRPGMLEDFGTSLDHLSIQTHRQHERDGLTESITVIGFC